ncbi:hypothetical protein JB92DRAFT_3102808 [Gautieria morchelliformis]|nr:hypothetical protein JB92DRAFT_3102808 [Gautieria morchelliformis]
MWVVVVHGVMIQPRQALSRRGRSECTSMMRHLGISRGVHSMSRLVRRSGLRDKLGAQAKCVVQGRGRRSRGSSGGHVFAGNMRWGAPDEHQVPSQAGSTESDVLLDGTEEIASYDESMAAGWSQPEDTLAQTSGSPGSSTHSVKDELGAPRPMWGSEAGDHPMASVLTSPPEVERYLEWVGERSLCNIPVGDGTHQNFWDILKKDQCVAVHLACAHAMGERRWVVELLGLMEQLMGPWGWSSIGNDRYNEMIVV